jgi:hypothetical protein
MAEHRIEITIDQDGKINAATEGIKGEMCLDKLQEFLGDIADLESYEKTPEWDESPEIIISRSERIRRS